MKRFYETVAVDRAGGGWQVLLDGRPIRTQGGRDPQIVRSRLLAELLADEWRAQGEEIDPKTFTFRDLADFAIDNVASAPEDAVAGMLPYAETDTLCYRAEPDTPLFERQEQVWEPLLKAAEERHGIRLERVSGIVHRPHPEETLERLRAALLAQDHFTLAGVNALASIAASMVIALEALEPEADIAALFDAANCEQDWQAELWGWDQEAKDARDTRLRAFELAAQFTRAARADG